MTAALEVPASAPLISATNSLVTSTPLIVAMEQVLLPSGEGTSNEEDPLMAEFTAQLFDNFFRSLKAAVRAVLEGSTISTDVFRRTFSFHIESLRVVSGDSKVAPLVGLVESFVTDTERLRGHSRVDLSLQIEEELTRLRAQNQDKLQAAQKRVDTLKADLEHIRGNASMTAQDLNFSLEQVALHHSNIRKAEEMMRTARALVQISNNGLRNEVEKQQALAAMTAKLQQEEETKTKELADSEMQLGLEISLTESVLREQAAATATENHRLQLEAIKATLLAYTERQL